MSLASISCWRASLAAALTLALLPADAAAQDLTIDMAKRHYQNGAAYYERANYKMALSEFQRAYKLEAAPELLYNMGRCHEGLGQLERAIARFEAFIAAKPAAKNRPTVEARVKNLRAQLAERPPAPAKPKPAPAKADAKPGPEPKPAPVPLQADRSGGWGAMKVAGWTTLGAGAAVMVVGGVLGGLASDRTAEYEDGYARHMEYSEAKDILDQAEGFETGMFVCLGIGGAAAVAGAVLLILDSQAEEAPAIAGLRLRPTLSGLALEF